MHERKFRNRRNLHCSDCCCLSPLRGRCRRRCRRAVIFALLSILSSAKHEFEQKKNRRTTRTKKMRFKTNKNMCHLKWLMLSLLFFSWKNYFFHWNEKKTFVYRLHSVCSVYLWKALERKQKRKVEIIRTKEAEEKNG